MRIFPIVGLLALGMMGCTSTSDDDTTSLERLYLRASDANTPSGDGKNALRDMSQLDPTYIFWIERRVQNHPEEAHRIGRLLQVDDLLLHHPENRRLNMGLPATKEPDARIEAITRLYLAVLVGRRSIKTPAMDDYCASALDFFTERSSVPRKALAWTGRRLFDPPDTALSQLIATRDELVRMIPHHLDDLNDTIQAIRKWLADRKGKITWGNFTFEENAKFALEPWQGFCSVEELVRYGYGGRLGGKKKAKNKK